jgi:hypothetical protein
VGDSSGAVVPSASVLALNTETGINKTTETNAQGFYTFPILPTGHYDVTVRARGFKEYRETGLTIEVNSALRVDVTLQVGALSQEISVSSAAVHVETTSTQMGEIIGSNKMEAVPLNGRSYTDLMALQPGVVPVQSGDYNKNSPSGSLTTGTFSVSGQRESARFLLTTERFKPIVKRPHLLSGLLSPRLPHTGRRRGMWCHDGPQMARPRKSQALGFDAMEIPERPSWDAFTYCATRQVEIR